MTADQVKGALREILAEKLEVGDSRLDLSTQPSVILVIGVNGVGKTTVHRQAGLSAEKAGQEGPAVRRRHLPRRRRRPAGDLGRAGPGCDIVRQNEGADPGAVLFDALAAAKARPQRRGARATPPGGCTTRPT